MDQRLWELQGGSYTASKEQQLRYLLEHRSLPEPDAQLPPLPSAAAGPAPPPAAAGGAAAAALAATMLPATEALAAAMTPAAVTPAAAAEQRLRRRPWQFEGGVRSFHDGRITMRREDDGHVVLEGARLSSIEQQLERILRFERCARRAPAWRSGWPLDDAEEAFVADLLEARRERLLRGPAYDDLTPITAGAIWGGAAAEDAAKCHRNTVRGLMLQPATPVDHPALPPATPPLPAGLVLPPRFRPRDAEGTPLRGPLTASGRDKPWNAGRQVRRCCTGAGRCMLPAGEPGM